jgi:hypothetical protein
MRALLVAAAIVSMTVTAYAQGLEQSAHSAGRRDDKAGGPKEPPKKRADEKEYKSSLDRLPDKKYDPWGKVR